MPAKTKKKAISIKKPKKKKAKIPAATSKPNPNDVKPLQFKVSPEIHQEFKAMSVEKGISMHKLFEEMYESYKG